MKTAKLNMSDGQEKGQGLLSLGGNLTLDNVDQIAHFFREAVDKYPKLSVELSDVLSAPLESRGGCTTERGVVGRPDGSESGTRAATS